MHFYKIRLYSKNKTEEVTDMDTKNTVKVDIQKNNSEYQQKRLMKYTDIIKKLSAEKEGNK